MEKQFESISELVKDEHFVKFVQDGFAEITRKRRNRPEPKPGYRYVRDWYDRMNDAGQLRPSFFIDNIEDIWQKRSNLGREVRSIIQHVCDIALYKTNHYYASLEEIKVPAEKPKKSRKKVVVANTESDGESKD